MRRRRASRRAHGSYEALLADPDVEAVYISLPNGPHVEWSIRCLEAGKHVLCEKPFARFPDDVERAFDAAESAGRLLMEAFMWRHHPQSKKLVELVSDGAIGELRLIRSTFSFTIESDTDVRLDPQLAGGALMDVGCYCISGTRTVRRRAVARECAANGRPDGVDLRFVAALEFPDGVLGHFDCAFDLPRRQELELVGAEGRSTCRTPWAIHTPGIELRRGDEVELLESSRPTGTGSSVDNFSRAIRGARGAAARAGGRTRTGERRSTPSTGRRRRAGKRSTWGDSALPCRVFVRLRWMTAAVVCALLGGGRRRLPRRSSSSPARAGAMVSA